MKKLIFVFAAFVAVSFASCGNKTSQVVSASDSDSVVTDSDSVVMDSDSVAVDSVVAE